MKMDALALQCRTCHATIRPFGVPRSDQEVVTPSLIAAIEEMVYRAPSSIVFTLTCGHGEYRGIRPSFWKRGLSAITPQGADFSSEDMLIRWQWTWWDTEALAQEASYFTYASTRPEPEAWDPPSLTFTCACGESLEAQGVSDDEWDEYLFTGWRGTCAACGIVLRIDGIDGGPVGDAYNAERNARYREALALWEALRPPRPEGVVVAGLLESEEEPDD